jgi:hypothetical protein
MKVCIHPEWQTATHERWICRDKTTKELVFVTFNGVDLRPDLLAKDDNLLWIELPPYDRRMICENGEFRVAQYYQILDNETTFNQKTAAASRFL